MFAATHRIYQEPKNYNACYTQENNDGHGDIVPDRKMKDCYSQDWLELILMTIFVWTGRRSGESSPEPFCEPCGSTAERGA